ncbi:hypothetical protein L198_02610 [Cryptococcus wingfieldii CBS 7118]|uniref:Uncharacterized protein n=1 Tax=Cryptococcus wingfieldii CBS 7118 TaxID=1295528 RepID=A0A1E3JLY6_9TREE|nr:hypothetical protein L198_02610 [Cryptococcus wingfieldii CBS 7118]ODO01881.1 hypothetical protein L198_02610 [Cryptococcus wingfieldii CBS 7118]
MSAPEENQHQSQDDGSIDDAIAQVERSEYNLGTVSDSFISTEGDIVHLDPVMVYTKGNLDGRAGFLSPDMIAKSIDTWNNNPLYASSENDPNQRVATLEEVLDKIVFENAPPAPGEESFMDLNSIKTVRRNVTVPLQTNSSEGTDEKKKPSWIVLRQYPGSELDSLAKSFRGDEDPSVSESINKTCPSLDYKPHFLAWRPGTPLGVNTDITHEGSMYFVNPACLIAGLRATGASIAESRRTHRDAPDYQNTFTTRLLEGINHSIAESFIRDGQVMKDNDTYTSYVGDAAKSEALELRVNADSADDRGVPEHIFIPRYSHKCVEDVTVRSSTELGARPSHV